jgi:SAM-dependent methyltransferase
MKVKSILFYLKNPIIFIRRIGYQFYEWKHPEDPWLSQGAVAYLNSFLKKDMLLFEWGSGRSTLWFSKRVKKVVSIEYNKSWFDRIIAKIKENNLKNIDLKYIALEHKIESPTQRHYPKIPDYVAEIFKSESESYDVIVVDGHYRLTCVEHCKKYLKNDGILVVDNSNREHVKEWGIPKEWILLHESENVMTQTTLWQKKMPHNISID